jgi:hypothetical protein
VIDENMETPIEVTSFGAVKKLKNNECNNSVNVIGPTISNTDGNSYSETGINKIIMEVVIYLMRYCHL